MKWLIRVVLIFNVFFCHKIYYHELKIAEFETQSYTENSRDEICSKYPGRKSVKTTTITTTKNTAN